MERGNFDFAISRSNPTALRLSLDRQFKLFNLTTLSLSRSTHQSLTENINGGAESRKQAAMGGIGRCSVGADSSRKCLYLFFVLARVEISSGLQSAAAHHSWSGQ